MVAEILRLMGQPFNKRILEELIDEVDADSKLTIKCKHKLHASNRAIIC